MFKNKRRNLSLFSYIGLPLYRIFLVATISLIYGYSFTKRALQSIKLSVIANLVLKLWQSIPIPSFTSPAKIWSKRNKKLKSTKNHQVNSYTNKLNLKTIITLIIILLISSGTIYYSNLFLKSLPDPKILDSFPSKLSTVILDRNGILLYQIFKDENRTVVNINEIPNHVKNAFLAAEDKDFYKHHGFSVSGLARALYKNIVNERIEGGSTITQQLVKNTLLTNEKTLMRKIKELVLSVQVESLFSKDKIFETYLNQVGFGGPAYGIQEASQQYFSIDAKDLSLSQAAFLAGLTQAPTKYSPFGENLQLGLERQKIVLNQMLKNGFLSQSEFDLANSENIVFRSAKNEIIAPHFVMYVRNQLVNQLGENIVNQGGLTVITTLDVNIQKKAQQIVRDEIKNIGKLNVTNGSALVTDPKTGEILAMVGSTDYFDLNQDGQVNLTTSLRQPGSSIKPLNYALAFEKGKKPSDTIEDKPVSVIYPNKQSWTPKNYDNKFHGIVTLKQALANSYNIPSVLILKENGILEFAKLAQKMGISTWNDPTRFGLSMGLGSLEVKMTDLATAYSSFANDGIATPLNSIKEVISNNQKLSSIYKCENYQTEKISSTTVLAEEDNCLPRRVISSQTAKQITEILSDNQARSSAFGFNSVLNIKGFNVAVKTGTSNNLKDNWTIGYNKDYLVATWVGNNDSRPMSSVASGITGASPIWSKIFTGLLKKQPLASN
jgi:penicillin-binding protein 1C